MSEFNEVVDMSETPHFLVIPKYEPDGKGKVEIRTHLVDEDFGNWMMATEYMMHLTAQKSNAGYERALELLVKGAMTWRKPGNQEKGRGDE